jgi:hypothetical protein
MTEDDPTDIDTLFLTIEEAISLGKPAEKADLDRIIAYQRKMRIQREAGIKTKKVVERAPGKLDVTALLSKVQPTIGGPGLKRRF